MKAFASTVFMLVVSFTMLPTASAVPDEGPDGRGCCSHHGGVCGCSDGRTKCCDGAFSPTCQCGVPEE